MTEIENACPAPTGSVEALPTNKRKKVIHEIERSLQPSTRPSETFISFDELLPRLPVGARSAREWTRQGVIPSIRLPGSRRVLYHWPSVEQALLRRQRGLE